MPPDSPKRVCFCMLTFHTLCSTVYVALPVPEQPPYSGYATDCREIGSTYWVVVFHFWYRW